MEALVLQYGDGTSGPSGKGLRARGFDVDSKVQVFETVIRGVGGLLSAHLFATGDLPIRGYIPKPARNAPTRKLQKGEIPPIVWPTGFKYDGQLLRLALDLGQRLLPAFYTVTGMPYPRVNLRHGIPFYFNSPLNQGADQDDLLLDGNPEITETCSAGAGSLVLEFTVLSRLTEDPRFEQLAKRAFWAVWERRSSIGLLGAGVDAENGNWIGPYSGIGAGTDSFFEYALKTHILLSGHEYPNLTKPYQDPSQVWLDPNTIYLPLTTEQNSPEAFLDAWHEAHAAIKRHLYSGVHHPHYVNVHLSTGSPQAYWIDSLGAYYPGLLALAGEVEEAIETNLLYTALWTRYAALPERFSVRDGTVEGGLGWWPGRPEFIESNYHIYRATLDPWYLHVGEMVLEDIKRRCWTKCGWSGLQDVRTGEKSDRMESFFLGETAKYMYLLFDTDHPLNKLDAAYVFTTEGHPLLIPTKRTVPYMRRRTPKRKDLQLHDGHKVRDTCPAPPPTVPFTISATAARRDIFHAASLIGLHLIPNHHTLEASEPQKSPSPSQPVAPIQNYTYFPWTLPESLMPINGTCDRLPVRETFTIEFPNNNPAINLGEKGNQYIQFGPQNLIRVNEGILVKSLAGLRVAMVYESPSPFEAVNGHLIESWRVWNIANMPLGRDEKVFIPRDTLGELNDPSFSRIRDTIMLDIVLQLYNPEQTNSTTTTAGENEEYFSDEEYFLDDEEAEYDLDQSEVIFQTDDTTSTGLGADYKTLLSSFLQHVTSALRDPAATLLPKSQPKPQKQEVYNYATLTAISPTGPGAAPLVDALEAPNPNLGPSANMLIWKNIYFAGNACDGKLPDEAARNHDVIIVRRGGCSFSEKLANIPSFTPSAKSLKLVIVISDEDDDEEGSSSSPGDKEEHKARNGRIGYRLIRPLLDKEQKTPSGLRRHNMISMVMVGGGDEAEDLLRRTRSLGLRRRYHVESQGLVVGNVIVV